MQRAGLSVSSRRSLLVKLPLNAVSRAASLNNLDGLLRNKGWLPMKTAYSVLACVALAGVAALIVGRVGPSGQPASASVPVSVVAPALPAQGGGFGTIK